MIICKEWSAILISVGLTAKVLFGSNTFEYTLAPPIIPPGHHAVLKMSVPLSAGEDETSVFINDSLLFSNPDLYILEKATERTECCLVVKYEITGYKSESYSLPPIEIKTSGNSFSTEKSSLVIRSQREAEDNAIRESFDTLPVPLPWKKWLKWLLAVVFLAVCGTYLYPKLKKILKPKKKLVPLPPPQPKEDPLAWLEQQIKILKGNLERDPANEFLVDDWGQIIRGYVNRLQNSPALAWTTREIKKSTPESSPLAKIIPCLETSDQFRFKTSQKDKTSIPSLIKHFIHETETHLILCGN